MDGSTPDACAAFSGRILDLANGEIQAGADAALASHLSACAACRRRLAADRADRAARDASAAALRFPGERSDAFWDELSRRAARVASRRRLWRPARAAASFLLLSGGGFGVGYVAGPWLAAPWIPSAPSRTADAGGAVPMAASAARWLGCTVRPATPAERAHLVPKGEDALVVVDVAAAGPAAAAGLRPDDLVLRVEGAERGEGLSPRARVTLRIVRGGRVHVVEALLRGTPPSEGARPAGRAEHE